LLYYDTLTRRGFGKLKQDISALTHAIPTAPPSMPSDSHEIELKFFTDEAAFKSSQQWDALDAGTTPRRAQRLRSVYFDTPNADLERHKVTLRLRNHRRAYLMTLKWQGNFSGGLFERGEIEVPAPTADPDPSLFGPEIAAMLTRIIQDQPLVAIYETDIRRLLRHIASGSSDIEIAFDSGHIIAGDQKLAVREIEMELKSGDPAELYRQGIALAEAYPVWIGTTGKSYRGALLASGRPPSPVRGFTPLAGEPSVDAAIASVINGCMAQFTGNWPAFESGDAVTAIHQMRVALRRLRALLGLFQRSFPCAEFLTFRTTAKAIAGILGEARNWDVFLELLRNGPVKAFPENSGLAEIMEQSEQHRKAAYAGVRKLLAAPETTRFVLSLQAFVVRHGWRNTLAPEALSRLTEPAINFTIANLNRMQGKLARRGKNLGGFAPHQRHEIRIALKKIRYAADVFAGVFAGSELRGHTNITARLQDQLGIFNDMITAQDMVARLDTSSPAANFATGIITGWCGHSATQDDEALATAWKKFRKLKPLASSGL
jgi:inorganic triphosphatase YgiF